jgi:hypothetical protein
MALPILRTAAPTDEIALDPRVRQIAEYWERRRGEMIAEWTRAALDNSGGVDADRERLIDGARD